MTSLTIPVPDPEDQRGDGADEAALQEGVGGAGGGEGGQGGGRGGARRLGGRPDPGQGGEEEDGGGL